MFTQSATDLAVVAVDVTIHSPICSLNVASATIVVDKGVVASSVVVDCGVVVVDGGGDVPVTSGVDVVVACGVVVVNNAVDGGGVLGHLLGSYAGWLTGVPRLQFPHSVKNLRR